MPKAGEGISVRINPEVYEALRVMKHGDMTFSDVIADLLNFFMNHPTGDLGINCEVCKKIRNQPVELTLAEEVLLSKWRESFRQALPLLMLVSKMRYGDKIVDDLIEKLMAAKQ